ncbi:hypothetical protein [Halorubrum sp. CBA1229]|uniref:DUF7285 family protein n=1 Tax=Halorubrum sp. CBA1229 TaxID=1853699 RepID=UPI000F411C1C|nr:hypothetical protein [Halorubrum sp. CBA1229]QKY16444.1 hypothetical protein Hrr1229_005955 [Halorubrum sp. CBA1229]
MSRSSGESSDDRDAAADRAAVEPLAALVAVLAVGAALGLYTVALDGATVDRERPAAEPTLDRIEREITVGGVVEPDRLRDVEGFRSATTVTVIADGATWRIESGTSAPEPAAVGDGSAAAVAERAVTVRVAPGRNVRGTLRVVIRR